MDWIARNSQVEAPLLDLACGRFSDVCSELQVTVAPAIFEALLLFREVDTGHELIVSANVPFPFLLLFNVPSLFLVIPSVLAFACNLHVALGDWFAEKVVGVDRYSSVLSGQIVGTVGFYVDRECRQVVTTDSNAPIALTVIIIFVSLGRRR